MTGSPIRLALLGLPGSGKSTVGRRLARRLDMQFVDSDEVIESRIGYPIRDFFEREGESAFRDLEESVIGELTSGPACVLSTGGGVVLRHANRQHLLKETRAVYLHALPDEVFRRLRNDQVRPLLQVADPLSTLKELYLVRDPLYREVSRLVVETGRSSVSALVSNTVMQLEMAGLIATH